MSKKLLNVMVGVDFNNVLMSHPYFQSNWKTISPCFFLCKKVSESRDGEGVFISSKYLSNLFQPYTGGKYWEILLVLKSLGIIDFNEDGGYRFNPDNPEDNHPREYFPTDKCHQLVYHSNREYLRKLHNDPVERRRNQKRVSTRKSRYQSYRDYVLDYIQDGLTNLSYDLEEMDTFIDGLDTDGAKTQLTGKLINITTYDTTPLKRNEKDGRVFNDFASMSSDSRKLTQYKKLHYRGVVDIRCCHPTYWATYITSLPIPSTNNLHCGHNDLEVEKGKWLEIFCDPSVDPKDYVGSKIGYDRDKTKKGLNETLNSSGKYPELMKWWKEEFPNLWKIWRDTDVSMTGCKIAKMYETDLMLDPQLYKYTEDFGIKLTYEYDGVGIFCREDDKDLGDKLRMISKWITFTSNQRFGVPVVVKVDIFNE